MSKPMFCLPRPSTTIIRLGLSGALLILVLAPFGLLAEPPPSSEMACDPGLSSDSKSPLAYKMRGSRCEGQFVLQVNNSRDLQLISLVESFEDFDPQGDPVLVEWSPPPAVSGPLHLRVLSWETESDYRMDAILDPRVSAYHWPTDVLAALDYSQGELGALAWVTRQVDSVAVGDDETLLYIPLRLHQRQPVERKGRYHLSILPTYRLEELFLTLEHIGQDGQPDRTLLNNDPLGYGYYPTSSITELDTPPLDLPGLYRLTLAARMRGGRSTATKTILFYHDKL